MLVWRIERPNGLGPFREYPPCDHICHRGGNYAFPEPAEETYGRIDGIAQWVRGYEWKGTYCCAVDSAETLAQIFEWWGDAERHFVATCYDVPPLYVIPLTRQMLVDRIHARKVEVLRLSELLARVSHER